MAIKFLISRIRNFTTISGIEDAEENVKPERLDIIHDWISIENRLKIVNERARPGDIELDFIMVKTTRKLN